MVKFVIYEMTEFTNRRVRANKRSGSHHVSETEQKNMKVPSKLWKQALKLECRNKGGVTYKLCHIKLVMLMMGGRCR